MAVPTELLDAEEARYVVPVAGREAVEAVLAVVDAWLPIEEDAPLEAVPIEVLLLAEPIEAVRAEEDPVVDEMADLVAPLAAL